MNLSKLLNRKWNYLLLAFLAPIAGMCAVMIVRSFEPFGGISMLYSDMYHQYYPFFLAFRKALLNGDGLIYNWTVGMGMDYLGLISYYLASPLNLLSVLIPEGLLLEYFSLLTPIKMGFAGMFFALFLKKTFHKYDFSLVLFGTFYAMCAWAMGYQWNVMWMDTFALLPLVALGTVALLQEKKFILYTASLFLSIFTNYYIGFFTCIFVLLIFICYEICRWGGFKKFICDLGRIALFSVFAIGMTAILEIPALAALQDTYSSVNKFPQSFQLNITDDDTWLGLLDAMRQVAGNMNGGIAPSLKEGLPNLYCGIITNILAFLFLTCKQVKLRDKICSVLMLLFFNVSFIIRQLDYIWHGFHFTNMIPYRFSFLYSFVMLYMAYRAYLLKSRFRLWQVIVSGVLAIGIAFCTNDLTDISYWAYNGAFLLLYLFVLVYPHWAKRPSKEATFAEKREYVTARNKRKALSGMLLWVVFVLELSLNLINFATNFPGTGVTDYPKGTVYSEAILRHMDELEKDNLFYRAEVTHAQTLNDGALNGYNGISTFTSSANVSTTRFMKDLGYGAKESYNRYCFEESSPVANLFLGIKYMIERQDQVEENPYFTSVQQFGNVHLLENNAYLPLGFLAENQLIDVAFSGSEDIFPFQNKLFQAATGLTGNVWSLLEGKNLSISGTSATINSQTKAGYCTYSTESGTEGTVTYKYIADKAGFVCVDLSRSKRNGFSFWKNGVKLYDETYSVSQTLAVGQVVPGDMIEVQLVCKADEDGAIELKCGVLDEELFRKGYDILNASTLQLTDFESTKVSGTISCNRNGVLYTSIPQNGNWRAYVDGKEAQIVEIGDAMVGLILSQGDHTVSFQYHNGAFSLGWKISLACFAVFAVLTCSIYLSKNKKGKYEK